MNKFECVRQGDVLLVYIGEIAPDGMEEIASADRVVLAYGEATGHAHAIYSGAKLFQFDPVSASSLGGYRSDVLVKVLEPTSLKHEEHAPIALPAGNYLVIRQVEYRGEVSAHVAD